MGFETRYSIKIDPVGLAGAAAGVYEHKVREHLSWIDCTAVGRLLLNSIAWHARNTPANLLGDGVPIRPYTGADCNAGINHTTLTQTGWSQPVVTYSPDVFTVHGACHASLQKDETSRGLLPDEILFHELVHALRGTSAQYMSLIPLSGGLKRYDTREEFIAVLVTNIYITDPTKKSKTGLRRDHNQYTPLEKGLDTSFEFYRSARNAYAQVAQFCNENRGFTRAVAGIKTRFNPIAAYFQDREKAYQMSNSAIAYVRDGDWQGAIDRLLGG
jgi:hypothetical protein